MIELAHQPVLPRDRSIGIGCIGSGFVMTECQLPAYRLAGFNPVAIASATPANARKAAARYSLSSVYESYPQLLRDERVAVVDIAVPPDAQLGVIRAIAQEKRRGGDHLRAVLAQKPLGVNLQQAQQIVDLCDEAGIVLAVNQNMRYDQSIRACKDALTQGFLGEPVLAAVDMRAIPHWAPWQQRHGWLTLRIMSIHHLDCFRYWFGDPARVFASVRKDPRTAERFEHEDGVCIYVLEYDSGLRATSCDDVWTGPVVEGQDPDYSIRWRVEGADGAALGTIGWPHFPERVPSTIDWFSKRTDGWHRPRWKETWFPDAFVGPMAELLCALEENREPSISGRDNLHTMALVDACYQSAREHRAVSLNEVWRHCHWSDGARLDASHSAATSRVAAATPPLGSRGLSN